MGRTEVSSKISYVGWRYNHWRRPKIRCQEAQGRALLAEISLGHYVAIELAVRSHDLVPGLVLRSRRLNFDGVLGSYLKLTKQPMQ